MNNSRIPQYNIPSMPIRMKLMAGKLDNNIMKSGDRLDGDDFEVASYVGYPSQIVNRDMLISALRDKLDSL